MTAVRIQADFFARMEGSQTLRELFEHIPGVFFFVKDAEGRHITANRAILRRYGVKNEQELVGALAEDCFPAEVAKAYREDDQKVITSGKPIIDRLELWYDEQHHLDWFLTTKLPLRDKSGEIIGVVGIIRRDGERMRHHDVREVAAAIQYARQHCKTHITTTDLARAAGVSERHLNRQVQKTLGISPYELVLRTRIQSTAEALAQTSAPIIDIALNHGFCDQSAFTQQFKKRTGMTPRQFRLGNQI